MAARPGELVTSPLSYLGAQASQRLAGVSQGLEKGLKWPFFPLFWVFSVFFTETSNDPLSCMVTSVEQLNSASEDQKINKQ